MGSGAASGANKRRVIAAFIVALGACTANAVAQDKPFTPSARPRALTPNSCPQRDGAIFADGAGKIVRFLAPDEALSMRLRTEMMLRGLSEPALRDNPRAVIEVMRPQGPSREIAVVPGGVVVEIGEAVEFDGGYWRPENACVFTPNLIRKSPATG